MSDEVNWKIAEWLGKCWHQSEAVGTIHHGGYYCVKCGDPSAPRRVPLEFETGGHPSYDKDPAAMLELIEAVRAKGYAVMLYADSIGWTADIYTAFSKCADQKFNALAVGTLPMAVALAVAKLIASEATEQK